MQSYKSLKDIKSNRIKYIFNNDVMGEDFLGKG